MKEGEDKVGVGSGLVVEAGKKKELGDGEDGKEGENGRVEC